MDFALSHIHEDSLATASNIRHIPIGISNNTSNESKEVSTDPSLEEILLEEANIAAANLLLGSGNGTIESRNGKKGDGSNFREVVDTALYPERMTPQSEAILMGSLVVIFESFDNLKFCYAEKGKIFSNRNGHFHHDDFIGKPYGCKIRSRNNQGWGFVYLLKPTPELWSSSLLHRTQIIHFLDASMIVFYLNIQPNMVVCESGTGSGALSHCIMRSIAPKGVLHTYEFNQQRAETARIEFKNNGVSHLSQVYHRDVCGKNGLGGGFDRPQESVDAIVLDLPEPWSAVPYAAHCMKSNSRLVSYSPCVEQSQKTIVALKQKGFHSIKTMEFRLKENYVDEMEYEIPPIGKRQKIIHTTHRLPQDRPPPEHKEDNNSNTMVNNNTKASDQDKTFVDSTTGDTTLKVTSVSTTDTTMDPPPVAGRILNETKKNKFLVARPFPNMRGHTAFLTFATAGNKLQPFPK